MKYKTLELIVIFILLSNLSSYSTITVTQLEHYKLICTFPALPDGINVYLVTETSDTIAKSTSEKGIVIFEGKVAEGGSLCQLLLPSYLTPFPSPGIFITAGNIEVECNLIGPMIETSVRNNIANKEYNSFLNLVRLSRKIYLQNQENTSETHVTNTSSTNHQLDEVNYKNDILSWIKQNKTSQILPYILLSTISVLGYSATDSINSELLASQKNSQYGRSLDTALIYAKKYSTISLNSNFPNLQLQDLNGDPIRLQEIVKTGRLTLLDFWASWCGPCRATIPELKSILKKYTDSDFTIIGISLDESPQNWKKAVHEDQAPWRHFRSIDPKNLANSLGISSIPAYILLDNENKIVALSCNSCNIKSFGGNLHPKSLSNTINFELEKRK